MTEPTNGRGPQTVRLAGLVGSVRGSLIRGSKFEKMEKFSHKTSGNEHVKSNRLTMRSKS